MHWVIGMVGMGLNLAGVVMLALADASFSRSVLVYLDALETNLSKVVAVLQSGGSHFVLSEVDLARDRRQDRARSMKLMGGGILAVGVLLLLIALGVGMSAASLF